MARPSKPEQSKMTLYFHRSLHARLERHVAELKAQKIEAGIENYNVTLSEVVEEALEKFLNTQEKKMKK